MKKLIIVGLLACGLTASAQIGGPGVQPGGVYRGGWQGMSFIPPGIQSLVVSNAATSAAGITNLNSLLSNGGNASGTNVLLTTWTNYSQLAVGTQIIVAAGNVGTSATNGLDTSAVPLLQDVPLFPGRELTLGPNTTSTATNATCLGTLSVRIVGRTGKTGNITMRFVPLYSHIPTNQPTQAGEFFTWVVAVNGATPVLANTNLLAQKFIGARAIRCVDITNGDTSSASDAWINELQLNGYPMSVTGQ